MVVLMVFSKVGVKAFLRAEQLAVWMVFVVVAALAVQKVSFGVAKLEFVSAASTVLHWVYYVADEKGNRSDEGSVEWMELK